MLRAVTNAWMTTTFEQQLNHLDQHHHHYLEDLDQHDHLYCLDDLLRQPSQPPLPSWYRRQSWKPCLKTFEATPKIKSFLKTMHIHPPPSYLWCHHFDLEASVGFYVIAWNCWHLSFFTFGDLFVCDKDAKGMISVSQTLFWKAKIIIGTAKKLQNLNRHQ